jgi:catechol 2,3-dioxygenase
MTLPKTVLDPPFNITRASHYVLTVKDLGATRAFYVDAIGLVVTEETRDVLYLRGLEEASHHSLVLKRSNVAPACERVGLRVFTENDLDKAKTWFDACQLPARFVEVPHQGRTLHASDPLGLPLELCASMQNVPRLMQDYHLFRGGSPQRLDHFQVVCADVQRATDFYAELGFRLSEYTATDGSDELWGTWLQRKGNPHDIVFTNGSGPRLHHAAYMTPDATTLIHACDVAGSLGYGSSIDRGPGRHGISNALFVYLRDPDGHRIELFNAHYQTIDIEAAPLRWDLSNTRRSQLWGLPAQKRWFCEATEFAGVAPVEPTLKADPVTLEKFLADQY